MCHGGHRVGLRREAETKNDLFWPQKGAKNAKKRQGFLLCILCLFAAKKEFVICVAKDFDNEGGLP
jgi:hypothetical protein